MLGFVPPKLGEEINVLPLGRSRNRVIHLFKRPSEAKGTVLLNQVIALASQSLGLEFVNTWSGKKSFRIVMTPVLLSIGVMISWIVVYRKDDHGIQTVVQTGSALASYIVTTGTYHLTRVADSSRWHYDRFDCAPSYIVSSLSGA